MPKELLVVDDEHQITKALKAFFEQKGFHVSTAGTAEEALEQAHRRPADVVVLDLRLPDGSGLDVLSRLKAESPDARVIIISGYGDQATIEEARRRGASDFLPKPFEFSACFYAAMGIDTVQIHDVPVAAQALARVPVTVAQQYQVLPIRWERKALVLAMADPLDVQRLDELKMLLACDIKPVAVVGGQVTDAIHRWYGVGAGVSRHPGTTPPARFAAARAEEAAQAADEGTGIVRLVNELVQHAYANRATDLHLGIGSQGPWIRERIDGILYEVPVAAQFAELYTSVISRIKVMASLDIAEHRIPQDGRIWFQLEATKLDLRISVMPSLYGESLAIRLLEPSLTLRMDQLGLEEDQLTGIKHILGRPTGMLLVTGPTGSGKSTSLYAFLSMLSTRRVNIVTIEDPVEHELPGVTQIPVQPKAGLTFATGLRSMLRHDPDIIMVGEIRDQDTASLAVRAALTGHLVLSTLHTNDAASGITRLMDLGVEPFLLCSTVSGILSQRLMRLLCTSCRTSAEVDAGGLAAMGVAVPGSCGLVKVARAKGCKACRDTGYQGRTGVFEFLPVDHHIRSLIIKGSSSAQIRQSAMAKGMATLTQASWQKVRAGVTGLEEVARVLPSEVR